MLWSWRICAKLGCVDVAMLCVGRYLRVGRYMRCYALGVEEVVEKKKKYHSLPHIFVQWDDRCMECNAWYGVF
jgi:hypothetical protein